MKNIWIYYDDTHYYELPLTRDIKSESEPIYEEVTMISGKTVMDFRGVRIGFTAHWDWFPQDVLYNVIRLIRKGGYFKVRWTGDDTMGTDTALQGPMKIEQSSGMTIFKFVGTRPMWHDVTLRFTAQGVKNYEQL